MFQLFVHESSVLFKLMKTCGTLRLLINAFYDTNFKHFQRLAETLFSEFKEKSLIIFSTGSTIEMMMFKPLIEKILSGISKNDTRILDLHHNTLRSLDWLS